MTVADLIEQLRAFDPDAVAVTLDGNGRRVEIEATAFVPRCDFETDGRRQSLDAVVIR